MPKTEIEAWAQTHPTVSKADVQAHFSGELDNLRRGGPDGTGRHYGYWLLVVAGLGIFCGCVGKSAQFPLHVWLPDAMEGPTPVSALVHSATMVAAGVYLVGRFYPVFTPEVLLVIAVVGMLTLFMAATIAMTATDIKRVLAYSTISQLGYMMLALGVGGWLAGMLHLVTHAFFKSLLFLCSGSVIHAVHSNEMTVMGGLRKKMPVTATTMLIGCLAIAGMGIPFVIGLSGYYSKDMILEQAFSFARANTSAWGSVFFVAAAGGAAHHGFLHVPFVVSDFCRQTAGRTSFRACPRIAQSDVRAADHSGGVRGRCGLESPVRIAVPAGASGAVSPGGNGSLGVQCLGAVAVAQRTLGTPARRSSFR